MNKIPLALRETDVSRAATAAGLLFSHQGKVRNSFGLRSLMLVEATDRLSSHDFVTGVQVPDKGAILTALTYFWILEVLSDWPHHIQAAGAGLDLYLPESLRANREVQSRCLVVSRHSMEPVECIVRGYLTGSGWKSYQQNQSVCGIPLPLGLTNGSKLNPAIFTPTTKAETGHDQPLDREAVRHHFGRGLEEESLAVYAAASQYALGQGVIIADTKLEWGEGPKDGQLILCDEFFTPDSSRFWLTEDWQQAQAKGRSPASRDKQLARNYLEGLDFNGRSIASSDPDTGLDPENPEHRALVQAVEFPPDLIKELSQVYHDIFQRLVGSSLADFQCDCMEIRLA